MEAILKELMAIRDQISHLQSDLDLLKRRLNCSDHDHDHDQSNQVIKDQINGLSWTEAKSQFTALCEKYDIETAGLALSEIERSVRYILINLSRLTNPASYIKKTLSKCPQVKQPNTPTNSKKPTKEPNMQNEQQDTPFTDDELLLAKSLSIAQITRAINILPDLNGIGDPMLVSKMQGVRRAMARKILKSPHCQQILGG
jgi:hypothetical protein